MWWNQRDKSNAEVQQIYSEEFVISAALELDVNAFIVKPVSRNALHEKVKRVLQSKIVPKEVTAYEAVKLPDETGNFR